VKLSDEFKVGVFASISIVLLILGFNFLKGKDVFATSDMLYAEYGKIDGLSKANPVLFKGLQIGKVIEINPRYDESDSLIIKIGFTTDPDVKIPVGSVARIAKPDILSSMAIMIIPPKEETGYVNDGDFLDGDNELSLEDQVTAVVNPIKSKTEKLIKNLGITIERLEKALDEEGQAQIKESLENFKQSSEDLSVILGATAKNINGIMSDFKDASSSIKTTSGKLEQTVDNVNSITDSLKQAPIAQTVTEAKAALEKINHLLTATEGTDGTLGLLLNDRQLHDDLDEAIKNINILVKDLKEHPRNYLRPLGKKNNP